MAKVEDAVEAVAVVLVFNGLILYGIAGSLERLADNFNFLRRETGVSANGVSHPHDCAASNASNTSTKSDISHSLAVTPAAIAGVILSV